MVGETSTIATTEVDYELICNVETLLSFAYVLPFLELVQSLSKFAQSWITFICDFIFVVKLCESNLQAMCNELEKRFSFLTL
jgi:hypothetical protein